MYLKRTVFLVVGLSKSGVGIAGLLLQKGAKCYVYDDNECDRVKANAVSYLPVFFVYEILSLNSRPGVSFPKASAKVRRLYQTTKYFNNFF